MKRLVLVFFALVVGQIGCSSSGTGPDASGQPDGPPGAEACPGLVFGPTGVLPNEMLEAKGLARTYVASVPAPLDRARKLALVFVWHGDGDSGTGVRNLLGLEGAAQGGAIFVYPNGLDAPYGSWDIESHAADNRDIALFEAILAELPGRYCIDANRIFSTGFSRGSFFTNHLACERGDRLRAIAPQSGGGPYWPDTAYNADGRLVCPTRPVPVLVIHGNSDLTVPNDPNPATLSGGWQTFQHWAYWNHPEPRSAYDFATDPFTPAPCKKARGLPTETPVVACFIDGLGHAPWSMQAALVWSFFASVP